MSPIDCLDRSGKSLDLGKEVIDLGREMAIKVRGREGEHKIG